MSKGCLPRIFWIGDSIAFHYSPFLVRYLKGIAEMEVRQGYREALQNLDHPRGQNCGDSSMVLRFVGALLRRPDFRPNWVFFNCGLHDIKTDPASGRRQVAMEEYAANLKKILELILAAGKIPIWLTTTPLDEDRHQQHSPETHRYENDLAEYNERAMAVMKSEGVTVIDLHGFTSRLEGDLYIDHVHFTEPVRRLQAAYLAGQAERILRSRVCTAKLPL